MKQKTNSRAVVVSALLTALVLLGIGGAVWAGPGFALVGKGDQTQAETVLNVAPEPPILVTVEPFMVPAPQQVETKSFAASQPPAQAAPPRAQASAPAASNNNGNDVAAAYQAQLEEAYAALQEAYTQIDVLQTAQAAPAAPAGGGGEHEGSESHERESHESHEGGEHDDD